MDGDRHGRSLVMSLKVILRPLPLMFVVRHSNGQNAHDQ
jgi:hypothetical protein